MSEKLEIPLSSVLPALAILRNTEVGMRWEGAKLGLYFNLPSFAWVGYKVMSGPARVELVLITVGAGVAVMLNQYLYTSLRRSGKHFRLWNHLAVEIETKCPIEGGVKIFTSEGYIRLQKARLKINDLLLLITRAGMLIWALAGAMALGKILIGG